MSNHSADYYRVILSTRLNWEMIEELANNLYADLYMGSIAAREDAPNEHYQWRGFQQGLEDARAILDDLPAVLWHDMESGGWTDYDPEEYPANWATFEDDDQAEPEWIGGDGWCERHTAVLIFGNAVAEYL